MSKRLISLSVAVIFLFVCITGRIGYIIFSDDYKVSSGYNTYVLALDKISPTLYYRNYTKATNNKKCYAIVIRPNSKCIYELNQVFDKSNVEQILNELKKGYPVVRVLDSKPDVKYIQTFEIKDSSNQLNQLVSYKSNGIFNHINSPIGKKEINFSIDANGNLLDGDSGELVNENYYSPEGYRLSIDEHIQQITIEATKSMYSGCAVVMNIDDCSILSLVNKPYSNYNIKAFQQYSIGSAFKLVITACAMENGINPTFNCTGSISTGKLQFSCQGNKKHGIETLKSALANSCNCYYVNLANVLGSDKLLDFCHKLGFDNIIQLFDDWYIKSSTMPTKEDLSLKGELSLFGFGQGKLLVTPLQMAGFLCTICNEGAYQQPKLFLSNINNENKKTAIIYPVSQKVLKQDTCVRMIDYMRYVVTNGTGAAAEDKKGKSAGKTATAQTGQYFLGQEKLNTWFVGVYPYDNPRYAIVIMTENGTSGSKNCCPIFRTIVEQL